MRSNSASLTAAARLVVSDSLSLFLATPSTEPLKAGRADRTAATRAARDDTRASSGPRLVHRRARASTSRLSSSNTARKSLASVALELKDGPDFIFSCFERPERVDRERSGAEMETKEGMKRVQRDSPEEKLFITARKSRIVTRAWAYWRILAHWTPSKIVGVEDATYCPAGWECRVLLSAPSTVPTCLCGADDWPAGEVDGLKNVKRANTPNKYVPAPAWTGPEVS